MVAAEESYARRLQAMGERARVLRLIRGFQQFDVARRAGVGLMTVRRFEKSGTASIENVLRIAYALAADGGFDRLFESPPYASLDDAIERPTFANRQRARTRR